MRLNDEIVSLLRASGLPWGVENGGKHLKLRVAGELVAVFPRGHKSSVSKGDLNMLKTVQRFLRARGA